METVAKENHKIQPFQIKQAIIGVKLKPVDHHLLDYLRFFKQWIPMKAAQWVYVQPDFSFVSFYIEKALLPLIDQYEVDHQLLGKLSTTIKAAMGKEDTSKMTYHICEGDPLEEVLKLGQNINADLLVIGKQGGKGYHSILAKNLIRKLKATALIVPQKALLQLSSILVPVDFSSNASRALTMALGMHQQMQGQVKIKVLYTYTIPSVNLSKLQMSEEEYTLMVRRNIRQRLATFVNTVGQGDSLAIELLMEEQKELDIPGSILEVAQREAVDLLVMGAKGHSTVERLLIGSVTEQVVNNNDQFPILIRK